MYTFGVLGKILGEVIYQPTTIRWGGQPD